MSTMISTKKLVNSAETCVDESIEGFVAMHPGVRQLAGQPRVVVRADIEDFKRHGKVVTVTGGGSGHEPCFMGYVGQGMMSAGVHGSIFASPGPGTVLGALRALGYNHPAGVLVVINNYTGDRLNFGIAMERARAEGIHVDMVINAEDCAISTNDKSAGRRGLAASIFIMKIIGHLAENGESLESIVQKARTVAKQVGTMGVCVSPCSLPGAGPMFQLGPREMELGMGLHGEAGIRRVELKNVGDVVRQVLGHMTSNDNPSRINVKRGDHVALLVNNLGSTPDLEMNIITLDAVRLLEQHYGLHVDRAYAGKFVTSLEMAGFSLTLMLVDNERLHCLDSLTCATAWLKSFLPSGSTVRTTPTALAVTSGESFSKSGDNVLGPKLSESGAALFKAAVSQACVDLITNTKHLNELDTEVGDGDCGSTLANGARSVLQLLESTRFSCTVPHKSLLAIADAVEHSMGGCSGALYSLFLTAASKELSLQSDITSKSWISALKQGIEAISRYGGAEPGDRTMLDALHAAWLTASQHTSSDQHIVWKDAIDAASEAAERTSKMKARAGRASYVSADLLKKPDAGAKACVIWLSAIFAVYAKSIHT